MSLAFSHHKEITQKVIDYSKKNFKYNLISKIGIRISMASIENKINHYCANDNTKAEFIANASIINKFAPQLIAVHDNYINLFSSISMDPGDTNKILAGCW